MKVKVIQGNRRKFVLRWTDLNGKVHQRTTDLDSRPSNRKHAYKLASQLESELLGDSPPNLMLPRRKRSREIAPDNTTDTPVDGDWQDYTLHWIETDGNSQAYKDKVTQISNAFQAEFNLQNLKEITPSKCRQFIASLRKKGHADATIKSYWSHFKAFLGPASDDGLVEVPRVRMPKVTKKMKGRPITGEEFERMKLVAKNSTRRASWEWDLDALWYSGLRISEAYRITWNEGDFYIDLIDECFVILGDQKNKRHQRLPITPEFLNLLHEVPKHRRSGNVFTFSTNRGGGRLCLDETKKAISAFGEDAGIKTDETHTASSHDLRRSFGLRWATRVHAPILQKLMRHASITTTMEFYAHLEVDDIKSALRSAINKPNQGTQSKQQHHETPNV